MLHPKSDFKQIQMAAKPSIKHIKLALALFLVPCVALADTRPSFGLSSAYDDTYAMDFLACPDHFVGGKPPTPALGVTHLDTQAGRSNDGQSLSLCFKGFATYYSPVSNTAVYSAHHLTKKAVQKARQLPRKDSFRPEVRLPASLQIVPATYKGSGYDRGHLVPNGDMADIQTQYDSFSMVNIVPQNSEHNRNLWRQIETDVRALTEYYGEVYAITGTAYHGRQVSKVGNILVPTHLYKAVYIPSLNVAGVYYSPNDDSMVYDVIDVETFSNWTGLTPFPSVSPNFNQAVFEGGVFVPDKDEGGADDFDWWQILGLLIKELWKAFGQ